MNQTNNDEIDLFDLLNTIWDGKWKVIAFVIISILGVIVFQFTQPKTFKVITEIKSITSAEAIKYVESNNLGIIEVTPDLLLNMYTELLDERVLFEDAIREVELLDIKKYEDKEQYEKAIISLAAQIKIFNPKTIDKEKQSSAYEFLTIEFQTENIEKWKMILSIVDSTATQSVKKNLKLRFRSIINSLKLINDYKIEDFETKIANLMNDYDVVTANRLAFLKEQSAIAHELDISMNTIESQTYDTQNGVLTSIVIEPPYYMRGYKAIDEEIKLMLSREDKKLFIAGLLELENELRELKQDQTLYRAENIMALTPIESANQSFSAARVSEESSRIVNQNMSNILILLLTAVTAGIIGALYVIIFNGLLIYNKK